MLAWIYYIWSIPFPTVSQETLEGSHFIRHWKVHYERRTNIIEKLRGVCPIKTKNDNDER